MIGTLVPIYKTFAGEHPCRELCLSNSPSGGIPPPDARTRSGRQETASDTRRGRACARRSAIPSFLRSLLPRAHKRRALCCPGWVGVAVWRLANKGTQLTQLKLTENKVSIAVMPLFLNPRTGKALALSGAPVVREQRISGRAMRGWARKSRCVGWQVTEATTYNLERLFLFSQMTINQYYPSCSFQCFTLFLLSPIRYQTLT